MDNSGPQQCQKVDVSQNVSTMLLGNRHFNRTEFEYFLHLRTGFSFLFFFFLCYLQGLQEALSNRGEFPLFPGANLFLSNRHLKRSLGNRERLVCGWFFATFTRWRVRIPHQCKSSLPISVASYLEVLRLYCQSSGAPAASGHGVPLTPCHLLCPQLALAFVDVWIWGWNGLAVAYITASAFLFLTHSSAHYSDCGPSWSSLSWQAWIFLSTPPLIMLWAAQGSKTRHCH